MRCLAPSEVVQYAMGSLSGAELAQAESHLNTCDACLARVETQRLGQESTAPHATLPSLGAAAKSMKPTPLAALKRPPSGEILRGDESTAPGKTLPGDSTSGRTPPRDERPAEISAPGELPRGTVVGRYLVVERLGTGAMGAVYLAYDPELDRRVALKLLRPGHAEGRADVLRQRLIREAKAMARLVHPNVVSVFDAGAYGRRVFVALEYVDGPTLEKWLKDKPRGWREVLAKFVEAGRGLAAAHRVGLVHRDFKAENVLIASDGRVKVTDFGLAHVESMPAELAGTSGPREASPSLTSPGALIGTPAYMAPEQFLGQATDPRTDQFNFCAALYEALYGVTPFGEDDVARIARRVTGGELPTPPTDVVVPAWVRDLVLRGLSLRPEDRHKSLESLLSALGRDPNIARRKVLALGLALAATVGAAGIAARWIWRERTRCSRDAIAQEAGFWSADRAATIRQAAAEPQRGDTSAAALDSFARAWTEERRALCDEERVNAVSAATAELRAQCLEATAATAGALAEQLAAPDPKTRAMLETMPRELLPPSICAQVESARPRWRELGVEVQRELGRAGLLLRLGRYEEASALTDKLEAEAKTRADVDERGQAMQLRAMLSLRKQEHLESALAQFNECARLGEEAADDDLVAGCRVGAVMVAGEFMNRYDEAQELASEARAAVARDGQNPYWSTRLDRVLGNIAVNRGDPRGTALISHALEQSRALHGGDVPSMAWDYNDLGRAVGDLDGDAARAAQLFEHAAELDLQAFGPHNPALETFWENAGAAAILANDPQRALEFAEKARDVITSSGKEMPSDAADAFVLRASALADLGRLAEARADLSQAEKLMKGIEVDSGSRAELLVLRARVALADGRRADAVRDGEQALSLANQRPGESLTLGEARFTLAQALPAQDRVRARTLASEAQDAFRKLKAARPQKRLAEIDAWLAGNP
ncbi:MAG: serine/threonine protein kinase [Deltaproteobacteria bacterium]|nr:serine/threonine protein kinase [Deltaproteobacteria bacterium]